MSISLTRRARCLAVQALYQWSFSQATAESIETQFLYHGESKPSRAVAVCFSGFLQGVTSNIERLDDSITSQLIDKTIEEINPVELSILRLAVFEMLHNTQVPYQVVINEAIELSKRFAAADAHRFINVVLDRVQQSHNC